MENCIYGSYLETSFFLKNVRRLEISTSSFPIWMEAEKRAFLSRPTP